MIRYALHCLDCETGFEAWFASSSAYDRLAGAGEVACPDCGSPHTAKQVMAPAVARAGADDVEARFREFAARARKYVSRNFDYVGDRFADEARAMYYGEADERPIWGETQAEEARALLEEGIPAAPLPKPFVPAPPPADRPGKAPRTLPRPGRALN